MIKTLTLTTLAALFLSACTSAPSPPAQNDEVVEEHTVQPVLRLAMEVEKDGLVMSRPIFVTASGEPITLETTSQDEKGTPHTQLLLQLIPTLQEQSVRLVGDSSVTIQGEEPELASIDQKVDLNASYAHRVSAQNELYTIRITPSLEEDSSK